MVTDYSTPTTTASVTPDHVTEPDSLDLFEQALGKTLVPQSTLLPGQRPFGANTDFHRLTRTGRDTGRAYLCIGCQNAQFRNERGKLVPLERLTPKGSAQAVYTHKAHRDQSIQRVNELLNAQSH